MVAMMFLRATDRTRYGSLYFSLQNQFSRENDQYPRDLPSAYTLICNYKAEYKPPQKRNFDLNQGDGDQNQNPGLGFLQVGTSPGTDGVLHERITCWNCKQKGHFANKCPNTRDDVNALQVQYTNSNEYDLGFLQMLEQDEHSFAQSAPSFNDIPESWVLLDSQFTTSIFRTASMLKNIRKYHGQPLGMKTNGGIHTCDMKISQTLGLFGTANIHWQTYYRWQQYVEYVESLWILM